MSIAQRDVQHIAHLARIELSEAEEKKFEKDLSAILEFVEKLNEVNTENEEPMTGGTTLENSMREDKQINLSLEGKAAELVDALPERKENWAKVRAVFE